MLKKYFFSVLVLCAVNSFAQTNFSYTPAKPQAGQSITITYTPAGDLAGTKTSPEAAVFTSREANGQEARDLPLKKIGNTYTATLQTDTADNFLSFGFSVDKIFDKNEDNGYWIQLYDGDKLKKGANMSLAFYYSGRNQLVGIEKTNAEKSKEALEAAFEAYPDLKKDNLRTYLQVATQVNKEEGPVLIQKEIENLLRSGLQTEDDYNTLQSLYAMAKLPSQAAFFNTLKQEKFPKGKWTTNEKARQYMAEKDLATKATLLSEILQHVQTDPNWKSLEPNIAFFKGNLLNAYLAKKDFEGAKAAVKQFEMQDKELASAYNGFAWKAQESGENIKEAGEFSKVATDWAKREWKQPGGKKPGYLTEKGWEASRKNTYAMYADTYAMVQYKLGHYKKGFPFAEEGAIEILNGTSPDQNNTYSLLAEKVLPAKKYIPQLEKFVKEGKATSKIKEILTEAYVKKNGEPGLDQYMAKLEEESHKKMLEELRKSMLDEAVKEFTLVDLEGNKVSSADLKDKVVVVDFWATWCGPCKASFPGMQKMVTKYKNDTQVKFVFIDTWENVADKEKNAGDFIAKNKYDFHVLMDNDNKVVEQFNVSGIPTKFVLDTKGNIRFKSIGFSGSDDKLVSELSSMIEMAKQG